MITKHSDYGRCSLCGRTRHHTELNHVGLDGKHWDYSKARCRKVADCKPERLDTIIEKIKESENIGEKDPDGIK